MIDPRDRRNVHIVLFHVRIHVGGELIFLSLIQYPDEFFPLLFLIKINAFKRRDKLIQFSNQFQDQQRPEAFSTFSSVI